MTCCCPEDVAIERFDGVPDDDVAGIPGPGPGVDAAVSAMASSWGVGFGGEGGMKSGAWETTRSALVSRETVADLGDSGLGLVVGAEAREVTEAGSGDVGAELTTG